MLILYLCIVGLCLGSFVNALVWRIHEQDKPVKATKRDNLNAQRLSILKGRSMCPDCKHELLFKDLIPIFSWISLKGKCRYCQSSISWQYPAVETLTALLFVASYIWWPVTIQGYQTIIFGLWLLLLTGFMALIIYDLRWLTLPNRIIYPLSAIALSIAAISVIGNASHIKILINELLAIIVGGGIFYILFQVSQGKWIGGGDVRLGFLLGLVVATPGRSILLIFLASLLGTLASIPLLISSKLKRQSLIAFGPYLIIAAIVVQLFGHIILTWYQKSFFPNGV